MVWFMFVRITHWISGAGTIFQKVEGVMDIYVSLAEFTTIETARLLLRPHQMKDAAEMFEYSGNPENLRYVFMAHTSVEEARQSIAHHFMKAPLGKWAIELKRERKMIGSIHFVKISEKTHTAEIGYVLNQAYFREGLMTEALSALVAFSFEQFGLQKLELLIDKENLPSQKLALKIGFHLTKQFKAKQQYRAGIKEFECYTLNKIDDKPSNLF